MHIPSLAVAPPLGLLSQSLQLLPELPTEQIKVAEFVFVCVSIGGEVGKGVGGAYGGPDVAEKLQLPLL